MAVDACSFEILIDTFNVLYIECISDISDGIKNLKIVSSCYILLFMKCLNDGDVSNDDGDHGDDVKRAGKIRCMHVSCTYHVSQVELRITK